MFYFLYGTDMDKTRARMHELLELMKKKRPDAEVFKIDGDTFSPSRLEELVGGMGLFEKKYIVLMDRVFENKETPDVILEKIKEIGETENMFLFVEGKVDKKKLTKIEKHAFKVENFEVKGEGDRKFSMDGGPLSSKDFNIFSLTDALGRRDKKGLWVLFQKAKQFDVPAEEISGILFWQVKALLLAQDPKADPKSTGLNPFVFTKSKGYARNFQESELKTISSELISMYHNAHRGIHDLDVALEKFILKV